MSILANAKRRKNPLERSIRTGGRCSKRNEFYVVHRDICIVVIVIAILYCMPLNTGGRARACTHTHTHTIARIRHTKCWTSNELECSFIHLFIRTGQRKMRQREEEISARRWHGNKPTNERFVYMHKPNVCSAHMAIPAWTTASNVCPCVCLRAM